MEKNTLKGYLKKNKVLFLLIFILGSCFYETQITPTDIPYFSEGDTIVYFSENNIDSFYVRK